MARDDKIANLPRKGAGAGDHELGDAMIHGFESVVVVNIEGDRDVDIEFRNNKTWVGGDGARYGRVDRFDVGGSRFGVWRNVGHDRSEDKAVVLKKKCAENNSNEDKNRNKAFRMAVFAGGAASNAFVFEFFGGEIVLGSFGVVFAVIILIVILPGGVILLPFVGNGSLVDWRVF